MRQGLRLLLALLVLCSPVAAQTQISTNINEDGDLKVLFADFPASNYHNGILFAQVVSLQVVNQYQCVPSPGNPPVGSIRVYCDSTTGNLTCINSSGGNCGGGGGGGGFIVGAGTAGTIPVFTGASSIGNSLATDNGTTLTYHGSGGVATPAVIYTGTPPFSESAVEGPFSTCLPIADGQDALCSISDLTPAGLWYSANGGPYLPLAPQGSSNGPIFNDQLVSGGGVTWTGLLNFTVGAASYAIVSTNYTSAQTNVTLAPADATNPRIDSIVVDNTGTVVVLTGTPAGSPAAPVPNPTTQLQLTTVTVAANATTPTLNSILVYDENTGTPTEWNCTPSANFNCNSTVNPFHGSKDIQATAAAAGNNAVLAYSSTVNLSTYSTLSFNIRNKATWPAAKSVSICFLNSTTIVGTCIGFKNGIFGFNQANVSSYQQIVIPLSAFALTGVVDRVRFQVAGGGGTIGFYLDWIQIQSGLTGNGGGGNFQLQVDGTATALTANLVDNASVTFAQTTINGITTIQATAVGAPPSGTAGGDLSGTYPNPTVVQVEGAAIPTSALAVGTNSSKQLIASTLQGNGTKVQASTGSTTTNDCVKFDANGNTVDAGAACGTGSGGLSGMTATQVPIAATATTVTSSKAIQGSDTNLLSSGTVAGTGASLCTDASGGATTSGCPAGGGYATIDSNGVAVTQRTILNMIPSGSTNVACVDNSGATRTDCTITGVNGPPGPNVNYVPQSSYTVANSDNTWRDTFTNTGAVAVTLPQAGTASAGSFVSKLVSNTFNCSPSCTTASFAQTASDQLLVAIYGLTTGTVSGVTDTAGDTFNRLAADQCVGSVGTGCVSFWLATGIAASGSNTVTVSSSISGANTSAVNVMEYQGVSLDHSTSGNGNTPNALTVPSTATQATAVAISQCGSSGFCTNAFPTGWNVRTITQQNSSSTFQDRTFNSVASITYPGAFTNHSSTEADELVSFASTNTSVFNAGWYVVLSNNTSGPIGNVTVTPTTSTINGRSTLVIVPGEACAVMSDGTNYNAICSMEPNLSTNGMIGQKAEVAAVVANTQVADIATTTMFATGATDAFYEVEASIGCATSVSTAVATLTITYTDTSNTAETYTGSATCTTLGTSSTNSIVQAFRAKAGTNIQYAVAHSGSQPHYDLAVGLYQNHTQ